MPSTGSYTWSNLMPTSVIELVSLVFCSKMVKTMGNMTINFLVLIYSVELIHLWESKNLCSWWETESGTATLKQSTQILCVFGLFDQSLKVPAVTVSRFFNNKVLWHFVFCDCSSPPVTITCWPWCQVWHWNIYVSSTWASEFF